MQTKNRTAAVIAATVLTGTSGLVSEAQAGTLQARFSPSHQSSVSVTTGPTTRNVNSVRFNWTRTDAPGSNIDTAVPAEFTTYCIELNQNVAASTNVLYEVLTPEAAGWTPERTLAVQALWGSFFNDVNDTASNAAFQIAMWELTHDSDRNLDTGTFRSGSPAGAKSMAQSWLTNLDSSLRGPLPTLTVLRSPTSQDQVTVIPAPGAAACVAAGLLILGGRRRR
jgi:hypothetical protein